MQIQEYLNQLTQDMVRDGYAPQKTTLGNFECLHIPKVRSHYPNGDALINAAAGEASLPHIQDYVGSVERFLMDRYTFLESAFSARIGIAVVVSETGISDGARFYAQSGVMKNIIRNVHMPLMLVDLKAEDVTTPKHFGYFARYPIRKSVRFARERFSLGGGQIESKIIFEMQEF